ncbi:MAG: CopD family protein [Chloroflexota bacterium]|nr:CopD family protein [Chloroflexota bacterium]MDE2920082.1 CopD family protein [Chloroflexota bacterium]
MRSVGVARGSEAGRRPALALGRGRLALAVLAALTALALVAAPAGAHANLVRSSPSPGTAVDPAPPVVYAEFSEAIDLGYSSLEVLDANGQPVTTGPTEPDPTTPTAMLVPVGELADGTYVVVWRTLSVVDGHVIRGSFAFGVGEPVAPDVAVAVASIESSPAAAVSRWLLFVGVAVLIGGPLQALVQRRGSQPERRRVVERRTALLLLGGGLLSLAGQIGLLGTQILVLGGDSLLAGFGEVFGAGQWGVLWIVRTAALAVALVLADQASSSEAGERRGAVAFGGVAAAGVVMAATISLGSHAAALSDVGPALAADLIHLVAVGAWVGGLPVLLLTVLHARGTRTAGSADLTEVAARFSAVATVAVGLIVVTGVYSAWLQVVEPERLWSTEYGLLLVVKVALVAPLLALGGVNLGWTRPRLAGAGMAGARAAKALRRLVAAEIVLAVTVLGVVGVLTEREPARQVTGDVPLAVEDVGASGDTRVRVRVAPGRPGPNTLDVDVVSSGGRSAEADIELQLRYLDTDLGTTVERPVRTEAGTFEAKTDAFALAGAWQVLAIVRQPGAFDARVPVRLNIGSPTAIGVAEVDATVAVRFWGLALAGMGFVLALATLARQGWAARVRQAGTGSGFAAILLGAGLLIIGPQQGVAPSAVNPIPPDDASVSAGREIYEAECVSCHGPAGRGDGPLAATLDPPPLDLVIHVPLHPDDSLFEFVFNGVEGTGMPAFGDRYGELDTWHIINFIQTLPAAARS